jgi:hypothetical protein
VILREILLELLLEGEDGGMKRSYLKEIGFCLLRSGIKGSPIRLWNPI